ncbi:MAG: SusD/RagB family nutrient-binding outer membrane lipoprotein, partial [Muribaculaceae bacterium]|nr:SusD/RagB family nutrient-binding outer membrane lipoprotein [Muribaculaceae bacterium]
SQAIGSPNYELIGRTIRLMSTQLTTDAWGDMPRSEAYLSNSPHYDSQASIYAWMLEEADELIALYNDPAVAASPANHTITSRMDRVYSGDLNKWKGLALAIKARILLRNVPNIDRTPATLQKIDAAAQAAIDAWRSGDLLYGSWFGNEPRYYYEKEGVGEGVAPWCAAQPVINSWESRANLLTTAVPSKFFIQDCMGIINPGIEGKQGAWDRENGYGCDPRLMLLLKPNDGPTSPSSTSKSVMVRYLENNIGAGATYKQTNFPDLYCGAYAAGTDAYNAIFTMEELYFIKAEAQYWLGNKVEACRLAKEATRWNVQRHLDRYLADNEGAYPQAGNLPGSASAQERFERQMTAFFENEATKRCKPVSEIGNKHYFFDESAFTLSDLMIQKYISMYMQPEQWTDLRRYHYSNNRNGYGIGDANEIVYPTLRRPYNLYAAYWIDGMSAA